MKKFPLSLSLSLMAAVGLQAATSPIYENFGFVTTPPQIDAKSFFNSGTWQIVPSQLYETANTLNYTNRGSMMAGQGFNFELLSSKVRNGTTGIYPAANFVNRGTITALDATYRYSTILAARTNLNNSTNGSNFRIDFSAGGLVKVNATNVVNDGLIQVGNLGRISVKGKNVNLSRGELIAGDFDQNSTVLGGVGGFSVLDEASLGSTFHVRGRSGFYFNPFGVEDLYFGADQAPLDLARLTLNVDTPGGLRSPPHPIRGRRGVNFALYSMPLLLGGLGNANSFSAFTRTNVFEGTNIVIQVVFVNTNTVDNIAVDVRFPFSAGFNSVNTLDNRLTSPVVGFTVVQNDLLRGASVTNGFYLVDEIGQVTGELAERGDLGLFTNAVSLTPLYRPNTYQILRSVPFSFELAPPANAIYDPNQLYQLGVNLNRNVTMDFASYGAMVGRNPENLNGLMAPPAVTPDGQIPSLGGSVNFSFWAQDLILPPPSNQVGRVEIAADTLNMNLTRVRAEGSVNIQAKHFAGGDKAAMDSGIFTVNLGSTNGLLTVSNTFPANFRRVQGEINAFSAVWFNVETNATITNNVKYHILIVDHDLRANFTPTARDLVLRSAKTVEINDPLRVINSSIFDAPNLTLNNALILDERLTSLKGTNLVKVLNFTNSSSGNLNVRNEVNLGMDKPKGMVNVVNLGVITANAVTVKSANFRNGNLISASGGGSVTVRSTASDLRSGTINASRDISLYGATVVAVGSSLNAGRLSPGKLILNITNNLTDNFTLANQNAGTGGNNEWSVTDGVSLLRKPKLGNLLGSRITSTVGANDEANHVWAGDDRGVSNSGFENNMAVGTLVLDVQGNNGLLSFRGAGKRNALYVDFLDIRTLPNSLEENIRIDPNLTIYFANANFSGGGVDKLNNALGGRFKWVQTFTGPNSSTNFVDASGNSIAFNRALALSSEIDSDGDGIQNLFDADPFGLNPAVQASVSMEAKASSTIVHISFQQQANKSYEVQYKASLMEPNWRVLTTVPARNVSGKTVIDDKVDGASGRIYRVRRK